MYQGPVTLGYTPLSIYMTASCKRCVLAAVYEATLEEMCKLSCIQVSRSVQVQTTSPWMLRLAG